ncbi:putative powdery mildew resistance protein, RPW8 [Helianthus anomalus]
MAELLGAALGEAFSELSDVIKPVITKTLFFKSELKEMQANIQRIRPIFEDMEKLNKELDRRKVETERIMILFKKADELVRKCENVKWDFRKRYHHASKLDEMNKSLLKYVNYDLQFQIARNGAETLVELRRLTKGYEKESPSGVPLEKCVAIGFDDQLRKLKPMVLQDSSDGDCSVVVVSAAGGCGKTTLVTMLCHDPDIKEKFGENIYHAVIPEKYNIKVIIQKLLRRNQPHDFYSDEDAFLQWGRFLANKSEILLVLDDVRSESIIEKFMFKSPGYRILVTSREGFRRFNRYELQLLNDQDATSLFHSSAFSEHSKISIPDDLVVKLVKCCKNHPLALSVIGGSLKGKQLPSWIIMAEKLSKGSKLIHKSIQECLEKSCYLFDEEPEIKHCYMDLGLFPEDQKIATTTLMDMWAHLYNHDDDTGLTTMVSIDTLSSRNLATWLPKRKHIPAIAHHCEEEFVTQHDMMRELAIHLSEKESIEQRERLIINTDGQDLPLLPQIVNARVLSITTGVTIDERFYSTRNEVQAPKVKVFVLNFMSNVNPFPHFMHNMKSLEVLIITNYGYHFSEIQNFPALEHLSGLTKIRLDHVSISSISETILMLENLRKLSLIMCKIGNNFNKDFPNKLTNLLEIDIESCDDLVTFPASLCNLKCLKKLSITNCHRLTSLSVDFGNLSNLEVLRLASCTELPTLPESITNLKNLRIIDLSQCLNLCELPAHIGELDTLETIDATGCTGLAELPESIKDFDFDKVEVFCDEEAFTLWNDFKNLKVKMVEKDPLDTFLKIIG